MNQNEFTTTEDNPVSDSSPLFDEHGRCIPADLSAAAHKKTRRYFTFAPQKVVYSDIHRRIQQHLGITDTISAEEFEKRGEAILQKLRNDRVTQNITHGVGVPFFLPKATYPNYGKALEEVYLPVVGSAFKDKLPQYNFVNHHKNGLTGKLGIAQGSRHERLLEAMYKDHVVGYFFPCLTEYSVPAAIEQIQTLPEQFLLAGGFDTSAALIGTPDLLLRTDGYPPLLWLAALSTEKEQVGYHFEAYGYNLTFNRRPHFDQVAEYWASGLIVLG